MTDIDFNHLRTHLQRIACIRPTGSAELESLRGYVTEHLRQAGWSVRRHEFHATDEWGESQTGINLIATWPRATASPPLALADVPKTLSVAAHLDSRPDTPGADDNASGVAALLEIARCWSDWRPTAGADLELVVTDLEERGMLGGAAEAKRWLQHREQLVGMISLEMLAYCDRRPNTQQLPRSLIGKYPTTGNFIAVIGNQNSSTLIDHVRDGMKEVSGLPVETLQVPENGTLLQATRLSDHSPFWDAGFSALMITDTSFLRNPHYHQASDTLETLDLNFFGQVTCGCLRAIRRAVVALG